MTEVAASDAVRDHYLAIYRSTSEQRTSGDPDWLIAKRDQGMERFQSLGFPSRRDEEWKYTKTAVIAEIPFKLPGEGRTETCPGDMIHQALNEDCAATLVFNGGAFVPELSRIPELPGGVTVGSLSLAVQQDGEKLDKLLGPIPGEDNRAFPALNSALWTDGLFVQIADGIVLEKPIQVVNISQNTPHPTTAQLRHVIVAGEKSQFTVVESYGGGNSNPCFNNVVTLIHAGRGSRVEHFKIQREQETSFHISTIHVEQERGSVVIQNTAQIGGALVRQDVDARQTGEGAETEMNGLYVSHGTQHVDTHLSVDHTTCHGTSRQLYKGVLDDRSSAVFNGKVIVRPDAQKTDSYQSNSNLLVSEGALVNTKPQLEIYADDVKCAHGATVGQIDPDALFYLQSRGLPKDTARDLLTFAFASDAIEKFAIEAIRNRLQEFLVTRLSRGRDLELNNATPEQGTGNA